MQFVSSNFNISKIIWTGDNIDHEVWRQTRNTQTEPTYNITQEFLRYFPNTAVYPIFGILLVDYFIQISGNHEAYPSDQYDTVGTDSAWLVEELGEMWSPWLDDQALSTFRQRSFYSEIDQERNLRIISLDTQACDTLNFYLVRDTSSDPLGQVQLLQFIYFL